MKTIIKEWRMLEDYDKDLFKGIGLALCGFVFLLWLSSTNTYPTKVVKTYNTQIKHYEQSHVLQKYGQLITRNDGK